MLHIHVILGSTREGRKGDKVARWFMDVAGKRTDLAAELIDLRDWNFPFFNEPNDPDHGNYCDPLTQKWAAKIAAADGYVIVTPEYNHGYPAVLKNALDLLYAEWNNKPVAFVGYGGVGGARAVEQLRLVIGNLAMADMQRAVHIQRPAEAFDEQGNLKNRELYDRQANGLLDQLLWWANALKGAREA